MDPLADPFWSEALNLDLGMLDFIEVCTDYDDVYHSFS
jgi:hypothetical protein